VAGGLYGPDCHGCCGPARHDAGASVYTDNGAVHVACWRPICLRQGTQSPGHTDTAQGRGDDPPVVPLASGTASRRFGLGAPGARATHPVAGLKHVAAGGGGGGVGGGRR